MPYFTDDDITMLGNMGYEAAFVDELEEGDEIAHAPFALSPQPHKIEFSKVTRLSRMAQYESDAFGQRRREPSYLFRWIAVLDDGRTKAMSYGPTWSVYRKVVFETGTNDEAATEFPECAECGARPGQAHDPVCSLRPALPDNLVNENWASGTSKED